MTEAQKKAVRLTGRAAIQYRYNHSLKGQARIKKYQQVSRKQADCCKRWRETPAGKMLVFLRHTSPQYRLRNRLRMQEKRLHNVDSRDME